MIIAIAALVLFPAALAFYIGHVFGYAEGHHTGYMDGLREIEKILDNSSDQEMSTHGITESSAT